MLMIVLFLKQLLLASVHFTKYNLKEYNKNAEKSLFNKESFGIYQYRT